MSTSLRLFPRLVRVNPVAFLSSAPRFDITEDDIKVMPKLNFTGKFAVINTPMDEERHRDKISEIQKSDIIGFDTESLPESPGHLRPCLIQLATPTTALLWRLRRRNNSGGHTVWLSSTLVDILTSSSILKVGHAICSEDALILVKNYYLDMKNFHDTLRIASHLNLTHLSLRKLVAMFMGRRLCKVQRKSDWEKHVLLDRQIQYACTDAWASLSVYKSIISYAESNGLEVSKPVDRAWNLLKAKDQENLQKRVSNGHSQFGAGKCCAAAGGNPYSTYPSSRRRRDSESFFRKVSPNDSSLIYERTVREEKLRVYRNKWRYNIS